MNKYLKIGEYRFKIDKTLTAKILADYKRKPSQSVREMAVKYKKSASVIHRLKTKMNLKIFKAVGVRDRDKKQHIKAKSRARKLYHEILTKNDGCIIIILKNVSKKEFYQKMSAKS